MRMTMDTRQSDIYVEGFQAQKSGVSEFECPYPYEVQPDHAIWWFGWKRAELATHSGPFGAHVARVDWERLHGDNYSLPPAPSSSGQDTAL